LKNDLQQSWFVKPPGIFASVQKVKMKTFITRDGHLAVLTVQNPEGNSLRYDGPAGITAG